MRLLLSLLLAVTVSRAASERERAARSLALAGEWMADHTAEDHPLNFDAVIVLALTRQRQDSESLRTAFERANARLDRDRGHPLRRFFEPTFHLPPELSLGWAPPVGAATRINPDRALAEALHCAENGWREETTEYVCGPMRDGGGYYSTHALWALVIARDRGCLSSERARSCIDSLRREISLAQPMLFTAWSTLDIDLFAERLVMLRLSGDLPDLAVAWPSQLLDLQNRDGSWGILSENEQPYLRFHATMMAAWALALGGE